MPFRIRVSLAIVALLLVLIVVLPLVIPIGPPAGVRPLAEVAGDASYVEVAGVALHVVRTPAAQPTDTTFVLLHGFASGAFSFDDLAPRLAAYGQVVAFDRPAFGLTERPMPEAFQDGFDPYTPTAQVALTVGLMDALGIERAVLVGHSAGGTVALQTALAHPDRVAALVLVGSPASAQAGPGRFARWLFRTPQMDRLGPVFLRQLAAEPGLRLLRGSWYDPTRIDEATIASYRQGTQVEDWDRALWQVSKAPAGPSLEGRLGAIDVPALVLAGADDAVVPTSEAQRLAAELPEAELALLPACGHVPQEECPDALWEVLDAWLERGPGALPVR